jgi:DNA-binding HxlR family transcriptional regulator
MADTSETAGGTPGPDPDLDCICPLDGVMELLSRRYAMQLICVVGAVGPARYGEIEETFDGVSSSTLSTRLDELVEAGILAREQYAEIPPRVEYELTRDGRGLARRTRSLLSWVDRHD